MNATAGYPFPSLNPSTEYSEDYSYGLTLPSISFTESFGINGISEAAFSNLSLTSSAPPTENAPASSQSTYSMQAFMSSNEHLPFENFEKSLPLPVINLPSLHLPPVPDVNVSPLHLDANGNEVHYSGAPTPLSRRPSSQNDVSPRSEISTHSNVMLPSFRRYSAMDDVINAPVQAPRRASLPTPFFPSFYMDTTQSTLPSGMMFSNLTHSPMFEVDDASHYAPTEKVETWLHQHSPALNPQPHFLPTMDSANDMYAFPNYSSSSTTPTPSGQRSRRTSLLPSPSGEYLCPYPYCNKSFSRSHNLKSHMVMHSNIKPFQCPYCPLAFRRNHDLRRHVRLHSGLKPFCCHRCGKTFSRSDALKRHSKVDACMEFNVESLMLEAN